MSANAVEVVLRTSADLKVLSLTDGKTVKGFGSAASLGTPSSTLLS